MSDSRQNALLIWQSAVAAACPRELLRTAFADPTLSLHDQLRTARRILVVGAGKAGAAMSAGVEEVLADSLDRVEGIVNVPASSVRPLRAIRLHAARPDGVNQPMPEGVVGTSQILDLVRGAGPDDVALCLLSGGGSALLPARVKGVPLADKQQVTLLLHACGATINEMNAVRKHLSAVKGGQLARAFRGRALFSLIISDVIGDPLDVIGSGPTAPDPTTYAEALQVFIKYDLTDRVPHSVLHHLERGAAGAIAETPKELPNTVHNLILGNNARSLAAARTMAELLGYQVINLGSYLQGETKSTAGALAGILKSIAVDGQPAKPPACLLSGGETTVTLGAEPGRGGRNQEFVLATLVALGTSGMRGVIVLSGGTDGEDGPTDAAGAIASAETLHRAEKLGLNPQVFLNRHDAYGFFEATGDLLKTGLTETNVMDVRVMLVANR